MINTFIMEKRNIPRLFSESFSKEIERLIDDFFSPFFVEERGKSFIPALDIMEDEKNLVIKVDTPGMSQKDISVEIQDDQLIIKGERKEEEEIKKKNVYISERRYGSFMRRIRLPEYVQPEKAQAKIKDGVLTVSIPKKEEAKKKSISVNVQGD